MTLNSELMYCILEKQITVKQTSGIVKLTLKKKTHFLPFLDQSISVFNYLFN